MCTSANGNRQATAEVSFTPAVGQSLRSGLTGTGGQVSPPMVGIDPSVRPAPADLDPRTRANAVATPATRVSLIDHFSSVLNIRTQ